MDEEKERPQYYSEAEYGAQQKEMVRLGSPQVREKLQGEGLDPDEHEYHQRMFRYNFERRKRGKPFGRLTASKKVLKIL